MVLITIRMMETSKRKIILQSSNFRFRVEVMMDDVC